MAIMRCGVCEEDTKHIIRSTSLGEFWQCQICMTAVIPFKLGNEKEKDKETIQIIKHAEQWEICSDVSIEYSAKGVPQPKATVCITRYLESGDKITDYIRADLQHGVENVMIAVKEMFARTQEMR